MKIAKLSGCPRYGASPPGTATRSPAAAAAERGQAGVAPDEPGERGGEARGDPERHRRGDRGAAHEPEEGHLDEGGERHPVRRSTRSAAHPPRGARRRRRRSSRCSRARSRGPPRATTPRSRSSRRRDSRRLRRRVAEAARATKAIANSRTGIAMSAQDSRGVPLDREVRMGHRRVPERVGRVGSGAVRTGRWGYPAGFATDVSLTTVTSQDGERDASLRAAEEIQSVPRPSLTIVLPAYNEAARIEPALAELLGLPPPRRATARRWAIVGRARSLGRPRRRRWLDRRDRGDRRGAARGCRRTRRGASAPGAARSPQGQGWCGRRRHPRGDR